MDPATLYILFQINGGPQKAIERAFVSVPDCHEFVRHVLHPQADKSAIVRYECTASSARQEAPRWYTHHAAQKLLHIDILEDRYRP